MKRVSQDEIFVSIFGIHKDAIAFLVTSLLTLTDQILVWMVMT